MKKGFLSLSLLFLILMLSMPLSVSAGTVNFTDQVKYYNHSTCVSFAKKLGLKRKKSIKYEYYYTGKKIVLGTNSSCRFTSTRKNYIYLANMGNKKLKCFGVKIGDSRAAVIRKMKRNSGVYGSMASSDGTEFGVYYAGFKMRYKNGKLASWTFNLTPTT